MDALIFLIKLAWDCRVRLPLLITIGFMILDIRMQLDINVETRRIPRPPGEENNDENENRDDDANDRNANPSHDSFVTA